MSLLLVFYAVPALALVLGPLLKKRDVLRLGELSGRLEYLTGHLRDHTLGPVCLVLGLYRLATGGDALLPLGIAMLSILAYRRHVRVGLQMVEFMRSNPQAHPGEFFMRYYMRLGVASHAIPEKATNVVDPRSVSYKTGAPKVQSFWLLVHAVYDTAIFARSAYRAIVEVGDAYGREVFDVMASLWGSRMLQLFRLDMRVDGIERFSALEGKVLLVCNHKSHLDFVFTFFALCKARTKSGRSLRPRFIAAKDHFVDNRFVRETIGIGKLIGAVDMVFVDRKGKGFAAMQEAADKLVRKPIDIALFPQGTRAYGVRGKNGEREDAGFYTTGEAERPLTHLKKGCAYLALDAAMASNEPIHLVFVGIDGTGEVVPKGEVAIQTEGTIRFSIGEVLTIRPEDVRDMKRPAGKVAENEAEARYLARVESLQRDLNGGLVQALAWHKRLARWFDAELAAQGYPEHERRAIMEELERRDKAGEILPFAQIDYMRLKRPAAVRPETVLRPHS